MTRQVTSSTSYARQVATMSYQMSKKLITPTFKTQDIQSGAQKSSPAYT